MKHIASGLIGALLCYLVLEGYWQYREGVVDSKVRNLTGYTVKQLKQKRMSCQDNKNVRCEIALKR